MSVENQCSLTCEFLPIHRTDALMTEMAKIIICSLECLLSLILIINTKCCSAKLKPEKISFNAFDFEQIKNDLLTKAPVNSLNLTNLTFNDEKCLNELNAIGDGLQNFQLWAIKGKIMFIFLFIQKTSNTERNNIFQRNNIFLLHSQLRMLGENFRQEYWMAIFTILADFRNVFILIATTGHMKLNTAWHSFSSILMDYQLRAVQATSFFPICYKRKMILK